MLTFLLRRLIALPLLLLVISLLTFMLLQARPTDFFSKLQEDPSVKQDYVMELRRSVGKVVEIEPPDRQSALGEFTLDGSKYSFDDEGNLLKDGARAKPEREQKNLDRFHITEDGPRYTVTEKGRVYRWVGAIRGYFGWLSRVVQGDLGQSFKHKAPVSQVIIERLMNTLLLSVAALIMAWGLAIPLGVASGVKPNSALDHLCGAVAYFGLSVPSVFLAILAVLFAYYTGWFPVGDMRDLVKWDKMSGFEKVLDVAHHLFLPASVVGLTALAGYMRQMRGQMVETMSKDYVRTARAKGVSNNAVIYKHALRNAINPLVTLFGFSIAGLLSGSFLVEVVMNWPGLARVLVDAIFAQDEPLVLASVLMASLMLVAGNLLADVLLVLVDPRIRVD